MWRLSIHQMAALKVKLPYVTSLFVYKNKICVYISVSI